MRTTEQPIRLGLIGTGLAVEKLHWPALRQLTDRYEIAAFADGSPDNAAHFGTLELTVLLDVVADRLLSPTSYRLYHGEDDRLALAVMAALHRNLIGIEILEPWVERLVSGLAKPKVPESATAPEWPTPAAQNTRSFLRALHLQLAIGVRGQPIPGDDALFRMPPEVRADLLLVLIRALRTTEPDIFGSTTP